MSARSRQTWQLGRLLTDRAGVEVEIDWHGTGNNRSFTGWRVTWTDGPTQAAMAQHAAEYARHVPAVDVPDLRCDRNPRALSLASAVITALTRDPEAPDRERWEWELHDIWARTDYPENLDPLARRRAHALLSLHPDDRYPSFEMAYRALVDRLGTRSPTPAAVLGALDDLAALEDALTRGRVVDLATHRARRHDDDHVR